MNKNIFKAMAALIVSAALLAFFAQYGTGNKPVVISMITPYVNESDMASINETFSVDDTAPWGFEHYGIDFFTNGNLKTFQAIASGVVEDVKLNPNETTSKWQVNVRVKYSDTYTFEYVFEPFSINQSDADIQLANIFVTVGQNISQGDVIGNLHSTDNAAHVHFGFYKDGAAICPEQYFTSAAKDSILNLIHKDNPTWNMCY